MNKYKPHLLFYAFDWDDNILNMPTEIIVMNSVGEEVGMSTNDFAKYRNSIGKENFIYKESVITGFPKDKDGNIDYDNAYRNFRDFDPDTFLKDVKRAIRKGSYGPAWDDFIECLVNGSLFAIITARGHESSPLRKGVEYVINNLSSDQKYEMYNNLLKFIHWFNEPGDFPKLAKKPVFTENKAVKLYLDNCEFIGVSAPSREGDASNPEQAKVKALISFKNKVNSFAKNLGVKAMIGFSDDDPKNAKHIEDLFKSITHEDYSNINHFVVKNTNNPNDIKKYIKNFK
jgi:hypothetical protein